MSEVFPFRGTLLRGQGYEGERRSELRSPLFPLELPLSGHAAAVRFGCVNIVIGDVCDDVEK